MTDTDLNLDELGPVDWIVVEFPGSKMTGEGFSLLVDPWTRPIAELTIIFAQINSA